MSLAGPASRDLQQEGIVIRPFAEASEPEETLHVVGFALAALSLHATSSSVVHVSRFIVREKSEEANADCRGCWFGPKQQAHSKPESESPHSSLNKDLKAQKHDPPF